MKEIPQIHIKLIEAAKRNERKAQSQLYRLYYKAIYNSCLRIVGDAFAAEDLMQDSFIIAFKNIDQFNSKVMFGAWIKKIAMNTSINYLRKNELIAQKMEDYSILSENNEEENEVETQYEIEEVLKAMDKLATNYRIIFSLYMIEGYDHEEIAEILSINSSTSRSQLSRAKNRIKNIINSKVDLA